MLKTPHLDISTQSETIRNTAGNPITLVADAVYIPRELLDAVPNIIVDGIPIKENGIETTNYEAAAQLLSSSTRLVAACTAYDDTHHNDVEAAKSVVKAKQELRHEERYGEASPDEAKQEKDFHPLRHLLNRGEGWLGRFLGSASDNHSGTQGKNKRGSDRGGRS